MRKKGHPLEGGGRQNASTSLRAPHLEDIAERLFDTYRETFKQAPESDFLLKRYFFEMYFEKNYLQDNVFFIPRRVFFSARFEEKVHRRGAESAAEDRRLMMENGDPAPDRFVFDPASSILNAQFFSALSAPRR